MKLTLNQIFQDGMVLQRDKPVRVWGTGEPGEAVEAEIQGRRSKTIVCVDGSWSLTLSPLCASEAEVMRVHSANEALVLTDVAVGEVFICGGQSNMEFWMRYDCEVVSVRASSDNPRIRLFDVPKCSYPNQTKDFDYSEVGIWRKASPDDLDRFSAVGYYFARVLEAELGVCVGLVGLNYGGTISSAWMSPDHGRTVCPEQAEAFERKLQGLPLEELLAAGRLNPSNDKGYATWPAFNELLLPRTPDPGELGQIMAKIAESESRQAEAGGLAIGPAPTDGKGMEPTVHPGLLTPTKEAPGALFTYMVQRVAGFSVRAVLWYQGESDDEYDGAQWRYTQALRTIMADWRQAFDDREFPFLIVQLPGFLSWVGMVEANDYPTIRACQQEVADTDAHAWLCSIGDVGEKYDIHPKAKRPVGERLALLALRHLFERDVLADAPRAAGAVRDGQRIEIRFDNAGSGLVVEGDVLSALEVQVAGKAVLAETSLEGDRMVIELPEEPEGDVRIRFACTNWYRINLYNSAHIPALPFDLMA